MECGSFIYDPSLKEARNKVSYTFYIYFDVNNKFIHFTLFNFSANDFNLTLCSIVLCLTQIEISYLQSAMDCLFVLFINKCVKFYN